VLLGNDRNHLEEIGDGQWCVDGGGGPGRRDDGDRAVPSGV
jgi:hypothetical protein